MPAQPPNRELRLWPGIVIVLLQWIAVSGTGWVAPATALQFFGMLGGPAVGALLWLLWWMFASRASWPERFTLLAVTVVAYVGAMQLVDRSAAMTIFVFGIPTVTTAFVAAALLTRHRASGARRAAVALAVLVTCVGWLVVRTEGVDGDMNTTYAWRWSATAEQRLLDSASRTAPVAAPAGVDAALPVVAQWPGFRGAERDGVFREGRRFATDWPASPPEELWRRAVGPGWSSFAIAGDRLYTQEQRGEEEVVTCYRASTGEPLWVHADRARFWEALAGAGPRATPTYHAGRIYAFGATGLLNCLDAETGALLWSRNSAEDTGAATPDWGFASAPLIADGRVVVHTGGPEGKSVAAYDAGSGEPQWFAHAGAPSYSSAQLATIGGVRQLLMLTGDGATGLAPENGELLWQHDWSMDGGARIVQPAVLEDGSVLIGTGFGMGLRRVSVSNSDGWKVTEGWTSTGLKPYFNDLVVHRDHAYGFDGRILASVDLATGERAWKGGRYGNGQLLLLPDQDLLLVLSDRGEVALVKADPSGFTEVTRFTAIEGKTWNHPVIVAETLYVRNGEEMAAFRLPVQSGPRVSSANEPQARRGF